MSEAFKCDYCGRLFEGRPSGFGVPDWPIAKGRLLRDMTLQKEGETWLLRSSGFVAYVNDKRADLCRDCHRKLVQTYCENLVAGKQSRRSSNV